MQIFTFIEDYFITKNFDFYSTSCSLHKSRQNFCHSLIPSLNVHGADAENNKLLGLRLAISFRSTRLAKLQGKKLLHTSILWDQSLELDQRTMQWKTGILSGTD